MELPAHEVLQSLQTLLSSSQIAVPTSNVANALPKNMNSLGLSSSNSHGCQGSAPTPPESEPASGTNGPPTPTHSERLDAEFRRGKVTNLPPLIGIHRIPISMHIQQNFSNSKRRIILD